MKAACLRLAVFDLDGTLIRGPTCCERIAATLGRSAAMALLERAGDRRAVGLARAEMARWYSGIPLRQLSEALADAPLAPGAREACEMLRFAGVELAIASVTWNFAVDAVADRLRIVHRLGTSLAPDGTIGHVWPEHKAAFLEKLARDSSLRREETAAVGDSAGDLPLLAAAGLAVFVGAQRIPGLPAHARHLPAPDFRVVASMLLAGNR
jgi:HAD superfamily phosphoserine phosphatase-like hydrolase